MVLRLAQFAMMGSALLAMSVKPSSVFVEQRFANGLYPGIQRWLTSWSNQTGVALFDFVTLAIGLLVQIRNVGVPPGQVLAIEQAADFAFLRNTHARRGHNGAERDQI